MDILSINLNLLKSFRAVYKTGGINKGARLLELATPAVAYNIKQLEKQLNKKLFIPHKKGVDPTSDANELFPLVENAFENLLKYNEQLNANDSGTIRLGLSALYESFFLVNFMKQFREKYPNIKLELFHHPKHDYLELLEKNEIDVALHIMLREPTSQMHNFELRRHPMVFFTNKEFAAKHGIKDEITLEQLTKLPLIVFALMKTRSVLEILENFFKTKFNPVETPTTLAAFDMTMNGHGICYFFEEYLDAQNNDQIVKLKIKNAPPPPSRVYNCAYHKNPSAIVALFVKELKKFFAPN